MNEHLAYSRFDRRTFISNSSRLLAGLPFIDRSTPNFQYSKRSKILLPSSKNFEDQPPLETVNYQDNIRIALLADCGTGKNAREVVGEAKKFKPNAVVIAGDSIYPEDGDRYEALLEMWEGLEIFAVDGERDKERQFCKTFAIDGLFHARRFGPIEFIGISNVERGNYPFETQVPKIIETVNRSSAPIKIAVMHHPPYSAYGRHPEYKQYRLDYKSIGIHAVVSGDNHNLILVEKDIPYFTVGTGGRNLYSLKAQQLPAGTKAAFDGENGDFGCLMLDVSKIKLKLREDTDELTDAYQATFTFVTKSGDTSLFQYKMSVL